MFVDISLEKKDLQLLSQIVKRYEMKTSFPEEGNFKECSDDEIWQMIVEQIAVIGKARGVKIDRRKISLKTLHPLEHDLGALLSHVNEVLAKAGARYVSRGKISKKAHWIADNFLNPEIVQDGKVVLLERMNEFLRSRRMEDQRKREIAAREFIVDNLKGFGLKSASDFLIELGYAITLIPFDVRELDLINKVLKPNIPISSPSSGIYLLLEESFQGVQEKIGVSPSRLDRIIFQNKDKIVKEFSDL